MNDKREDARRMAEQLIADEKQSPPGSAVRAYLIAAILGLILWIVVYFIWRSF
ncbi:MAG: hypothetical protein AB7F74_15340 [Parvibaculaceae bacterium]